MFELRRVEQFSFLIQVFQDFRIRLLDEHSGISRFLRHLALAVYELHKRQIVFASYLCIVFTESRRDMNDTSTVRHRNIIIACYKMRFFMLFCCRFSGTDEQWLIFLIFQIRSHIAFQHFPGRLFFLRQFTEHLVEQRFRHVINKTVRRFHFYIAFLRIHTQCDVRRKRPGRRSPCEEVRVFADYFKTNYRGTLFYRLISLRHLVGGKRRSAARTVGHNFKSFIQKSFVPDFF